MIALIAMMENDVPRRMTYNDFDDPLLTNKSTLDCELSSFRGTQTFSAIKTQKQYIFNQNAVQMEHRLELSQSQS